VVEAVVEEAVVDEGLAYVGNGLADVTRLVFW